MYNVVNATSNLESLHQVRFKFLKDNTRLVPAGYECPTGFQEDLPSFDKVRHLSPFHLKTILSDGFEGMGRIITL